MCWESRFPPAVGSRTQARGTGLRGPGSRSSPSIPPRAGVMLPRLCPGQTMGVEADLMPDLGCSSPRGDSVWGVELGVVRFLLVLLRAVG